MLNQMILKGMHRATALLFKCLLLCSVLVPLMAEEEMSYIGNGNFEQVDANGVAVGWKFGKEVTWESEGENHFMRITSDQPKNIVSNYSRIYIKEPAEALRLSYKVRYNNVVPGKANWHDARIVMNFRGAKDVKLGSGPAPSYKGTQTEWKEGKVDFLVPEGLAYIEFMPSMYYVKSGQIDFDDFVLTPTDAAPIHQAAKEKEEQRLAEIARRAALVKPQVAIANPVNYPDEVKVSGNVLVSVKDGRMVWLQGVSIASLEWSAGGDQILKSLDVAINQWKSNCIRLPIAEHFYEGVGPWQRDGGAGYRQLVDDAVNYCADRGVYIVLDLHRYRAPTQVHVNFWKIVAAKYKNHPAVLFDLLNEPHDISWDVWKNGGNVDDKKSSPANVAAENNEKLSKDYSVGMQAMLNAVRAVGAKNVVIAGGLDWAYDLSGILKGYALDDPQGNGVVYSTHIYPWKKNWKEMFMDIAKVHPLFIGEVGCMDKPMPWQKTTEDPKKWAPDMLGVIQDLKLNWTAWCFHPSASPCILLNWDYEPTPAWGEFVKDALSGKQFPVGKLR